MPATDHFRFLLLAALLCLSPALPAAESQAAESAESQAAESQAAESKDAVGAPADSASPWEHPLWHDATTLMRLYVCDHARRPPSWCAERSARPQALPAEPPLPAVQGPPLSPEDAAWIAFLKDADPADLSAAQQAMVRRRAIERRDPQAMEILGFLYAEGLSVPRDYAESYRWYGMAFLAGEQRVRPNLDIVWELLQRHNLESALALKREFDALAAGEVPAGLPPAADPPAQTR